MYGWRQMNPLEARKSVQRLAEYFEGQLNKPVQKEACMEKREKKKWVMTI